MRALIIVGAVALIAAIVFAVNALLALGAQYVLAAFGVAIGFWPCFVAVLVIGALFGRARMSKSES